MSQQADRSRCDEKRLPVEEIGGCPAADGVASDEEASTAQVPEDETKVSPKMFGARVTPAAVGRDHLADAVIDPALCVEMTVEGDDELTCLVGSRSRFDVG
jgi:hypothetical protein